MIFESDIAIIGGGPSGLFASYRACVLGLKAVVIECLSELGGQCSVLYPTKPIYDLPGHLGILGGDLISNIYKQVQTFNVDVILNTKVESINDIGQHFVIKTNNASQAIVKAVIIASGGGAFYPNKLSIAGTEHYENQSIFYSIKDLERFKNKIIMVIGGGNTALDWVLHLAPVVQKIYLVHRRNKFQAVQSSLMQLESLVKTNLVELLVPYQIQSIVGGDGGNIEYAEISNLDGDIKRIEVNAILPFFGLSADSSTINKWGVTLSENHKRIIVNNTDMQTNINGVYAIGDVVHYNGKIKSLLSGFQEAYTACHSIHKMIA